MSTRKARQAATLLESGLRQFQQGQIEQARQSCKRALELTPRHPDALHLLGVIALQRGEHAAAVEMLQRAVAIRPDEPAFQANLAHGYVGLKRLPEALAAFERAARLEPNDPELQLGVGSCLGLMGKAAEAEAALRRLVERHPQNPLAWFNLAKALDDQKQYEEACRLYARVTQLAPEFADAYNNLGIALYRLERYEEAEQALRACLARNPGLVSAYVNLAVVLNSLRRHEEAEVLCRDALKRSRGEIGAWAILGRSLIHQNRWAEALRCFEEALKEDPEEPELLGYLGQALAGNGRIEEALETFDRAIFHGANIPDMNFVHFAKASALFSAGRIREGAATYLGRDERHAFASLNPVTPIPAALPQDMHGQKVCLLGEQGIGDQIFFLRYAPLLKARGCRVIFHGTAKITSILARSAALDQVLPRTESITAADFTLLVGDLPHVLDGGYESSSFVARSVSLGAGADADTSARAFFQHCRVYWPELPPPYLLQPLADRIASVTRRLQEQVGPPPYVGLSWRAGTRPQEQRGTRLSLYKEIPLDCLAQAIGDTGGTLVSLQRHPLAGETDRLAALIGRPVHDLSATNEDLEEMLALLAVLDEYVGVSNTNMHLRASAGRTARVIVPWPAEWRWMISGNESPWFRGFRIYRQKPSGDWSATLERLRSDLLAAFGNS